MIFGLKSSALEDDEVSTSLSQEAITGKHIAYYLTYYLKKYKNTHLSSYTDSERIAANTPLQFHETSGILMMKLE